jgi:uncharacterized protein YegL
MSATASPPRVRERLVVVLADASGSMAEDAKLIVLGDGVAALARALAVEQPPGERVRLAVIAFGGEAAQLVQPPTPVEAFAWTPPQAGGRTPLGSALARARELLEELAPDAGQPALVLVSDGRPTDDWSAALERLLASERGAQALRIAIAVGPDADRRSLAAFAGGAGARVLDAFEAADVAAHFRTIAATVAPGAARAATLAALRLGPPTDLDALDV